MKTVNVIQEDVAQTFDINVVGRANNIELTLAESLIETNGTRPTWTSASANTTVTDGIAPPTSTWRGRWTTDLDSTELTPVPVYFNVTPPRGPEIADRRR